MNNLIIKQYYGDYGEIETGAASTISTETAWPLWEVFIRSKQGLVHKHAGSLHAADEQMANENASKNLRLNYLVSDAGWNPIYDLRVANITAPIFIQQKANVFQNTGIDWEQVKITLSTGNPIDNGILPALNPLYSDIYSYQRTKSLDMIENVKV